MNKRKIFIFITVLMGLLIIMSLFAASTYIRKRLTDNLITEYSQQEGLVARQIAQTLELQISQTEAKLNLIAQLPEVMSGSADICNKKLQDIFEDSQTKVGNLGRVDEDGRFRCSLNQKLTGIKANTLGTYIDDIFADPAHAPVMSRAIKPPGSPSYVVAIHVPVRDAKGEFIGTLGGAVYLNDMEKLYIKNTALPPGGFIALYDDDGTVLYHLKPELIGINLASTQFQSYIKGGLPPGQVIENIKKGLSGTLRYSFDNDEKIIAYEPIHVFPGRNWRVSMTLPISAADETIRTVGLDKLLTELPFVLCVLTVLIFVFFIWAIRKEVFHPLEIIDKAKSEFVSLASHQLRTPLSMINWYTEMMLAGDAGVLNKKQTRYLQEISHGSQRMVQLVNALLNVSRLELGTFIIEPEKINMNSLIKSVTEEQKMAIDKKKQHVALQLPERALFVSADPKLFRMVMQNLLSNAVKYTPEEGTVTVSLSDEAENILIAISDNGYGIPESQKEKIFTKLFRADNVREKDTEGTGLGLYIVKSIVDKSGGAIRFETEENKGTTFYIRIPKRGIQNKKESKFFKKNHN